MIRNSAPNFQEVIRSAKPPPVIDWVVLLEVEEITRSTSLINFVDNSAMSKQEVPVYATHCYHIFNIRK